MQYLSTDLVPLINNDTLATGYTQLQKEYLSLIGLPTSRRRFARAIDRLPRGYLIVVTSRKSNHKFCTIYNLTLCISWTCMLIINDFYTFIFWVQRCLVKHRPCLFFYVPLQSRLLEEWNKQPTRAPLQKSYFSLSIMTSFLFFRLCTCRESSLLLVGVPTGVLHSSCTPLIWKGEGSGLAHDRMIEYW